MSSQNHNQVCLTVTAITKYKNKTQEHY